MVALVLTTLGGALVSAAASAFIGYRQGRTKAEAEHDRETEVRLRDCEFELADIRATLRERKQRR